MISEISTGVVIGFIGTILASGSIHFVRLIHLSKVINNDIRLRMKQMNKLISELKHVQSVIGNPKVVGVVKYDIYRESDVDLRSLCSPLELYLIFGKSSFILLECYRNVQVVYSSNPLSMIEKYRRTLELKNSDSIQISFNSIIAQCSHNIIVLEDCINGLKQVRPRFSNLFLKF